jgi:PIN domain nuclease of toxin-antitoxin system
VRVLLDTHAFLWFLAGDDRLPERVRELVVDPRNEVLLSMASVWEMAIKASMGKLVLTRPFDAMIREQLSRQRIGLFGVELAHVLRVAVLPFHHRDPFDRLIVAQALVEGIPVAGADAAFDAYGVTRIW